MCKECFHCHYGQRLNTITNKVPCKLFNLDVLNTEAEDCEDFIPTTPLDTDDIEIVTEYIVHSTCPFCGVENELYDAEAEGEEIIECENCGKKYSISWSLY